MIKYMKNIDGKTTGRLEGDTYYCHKNVNHFFRKHRGFAMSKTMIDELIREGCKFVVIYYHGAKRTTYKCSIDAFLRSGIRELNKQIDLQHVVPTREMGVIDVQPN